MDSKRTAQLREWYEQQTGETMPPQAAARLYRINEWLRKHRLSTEQAQLIVSASDRWGTARQRPAHVRDIAAKVGTSKRASSGRSLYLWITPLVDDGRELASESVRASLGAA